jgi:hypothetical protein
MVRRKVKAKEPKDVDMTPKDVADLFSDLKRPVSSREVIGHHL